MVLPAAVERTICLVGFFGAPGGVTSIVVLVFIRFFVYRDIYLDYRDKTFPFWSYTHTHRGFRGTIL